MLPSQVSRSLASRSFGRMLQVSQTRFVQMRFVPGRRAFSWKSMQPLFAKVGGFFAGIGWAAKGAVRAESVQAASRIAGVPIETAPKRAHIYFLLDRSGSMSSIADDVIGGFNAFVEEQQIANSDSTGLDMTMVQFDSQNPEEVLFADRDIGNVPPLCKQTFKPRAMTPLFDAIGGIISRAEAAEKAENAEKQIVIVTFSDGMENASREHSKEAIFSRIDYKQKEGWTFVFLGANQDSYAEGGKLGHAKANIQNFKFDGQGTQMAWQALSGATQTMRVKLCRKDRGVYSNEDFFDGVKVAESDYTSRTPDKDSHSRS